MNEDWNLGADIVAITHRWQIIIAIFLIGSLTGWGIGYMLPAPYRSDTSIYIGYNADLFLRNPDDYKNWYLSQLEIFIISDPVLQKVMNRLRAQDSYWLTYDIEDLRPKLSTYWRNAGRWRLVAEWADQEHTFQLAHAWGEVVLSSVNQAISDASSLILINSEFNATSNALIETRLREQNLSQAKSALRNWQEGLNTTNTSIPLDPLERWRLQSLAATLVDLNPVDIDLLVQLPALDAPAGDYLPWVVRLITTADNQLATLEVQSVSLEARIAELQASYQNAINASYGLSAYLVIELFEQTTTAQPIRRSSQMALVGGLIGILGYTLFGLARPIRKANR